MSRDQLFPFTSEIQYSKNVATMNMGVECIPHIAGRQALYAGTTQLLHMRGMHFIFGDKTALFGLTSFKMLQKV